MLVTSDLLAPRDPRVTLEMLDRWDGLVQLGMKALQDLRVQRVTLVTKDLLVPVDLEDPLAMMERTAEME